MNMYDYFIQGNQHVKQMPYKQQYETLMQDFFGWADSYEYYLSKLGYQTPSIIPMLFLLPRAVAKENNTT